jgi:hypothetical protein
VFPFHVVHILSNDGKKIRKITVKKMPLKGMKSVDRLDKLKLSASIQWLLSAVE